MGRSARALTAVVVVVFVVGNLAAVGQAAPAAPVMMAQEVTTAGGYRPSRQECQFLNEINRYRASRNKPKLVLSRPLGAAAEAHTRDMARKRSLYHTPDLFRTVRRFGYDGNRVGENVAVGYPTAKAVFGGWKRSAGHDRNMLDGRFRAIGIAEQNGYWTTIFGDRVDQTIRC